MNGEFKAVNGGTAPGKVLLDEVPPLGSVLSYDGQPFLLARTAPYEYPDGRIATELFWLSRCIRCDAEFEGRSISGVAYTMTRRCPEHRDGTKIRKRADDAPRIYLIVPDAVGMTRQAAQ